MCAWPTASSRTKNWGNEVLTDTDQESQLDLLHTYFNDSLNATTGHGHTGGTSDGPKIVLTTAVTGTLPLANGGTGQTTLAALMNLMYPVGSVYTNRTDSTNPATLLGFGTWTAIQGEVVVGYKAADANFGTLGSVAAGEATHTLSTAEMPAHTHTVATTNTGSGTVPAFNGSASSSITTSSTGGGGAHNNIQPSHVCYVWYRSA